MKKMLGLIFTALVIAAGTTAATYEPSQPVKVLSTAVAGDSVVILAQIAQNTTAQPVTVDSMDVFARIDRGVAGGGAQPGDTAFAKVAVTTWPVVVRLVYPRSPLWGANTNRNGAIGVRLGRTDPMGGVSAIWTGWVKTGNSAWSFTYDQRAPNPVEVDKITVTSVGLN